MSSPIKWAPKLSRPGAVKKAFAVLLAFVVGLSGWAYVVANNSKISEDMRKQLAKQYAQTELKVVDVSEVEQDGAKTLSITFSAPLDDQQDFSRYVHLNDKQSGKVDASWITSQSLTSLNFMHVEPKRELILTVDAGIASIAGKKMAASYTTTLTTNNLESMIGFASRGSILPTKLAEGLPVLTINVNEVEVEFFRVRDDKLIDAARLKGSGLYAWNIKDYGDLVYTRAYRLKPQRNTRETVLLPISDIKPLQKPGIYIAAMRERGDYQRGNSVALLTLSDIGLSIHRYRNRIEVVAQSIEDGASLSNVQISLTDNKNHQLAKATTDSQGRARLPWDAKAILVMAQKGGNTTALSLEQSALDLSEFDIDGKTHTAAQFFMFGPRDIYRPGETILLNALLRDADGRPVSKQPVKVSLIQPDDKIKTSFSWNPQEQGFYQHQFITSVNDPSGTWRVEADFGDPNRKVNYEFKLEDFLPERIALEIESNDEPVGMDEQPVFGITGRYLYGAPASGNTLLSKLFVRSHRNAVPTLPGYQFGSITEKIESADIDLDEQKLDNQGKAIISPKNEWAEAKSPVQLVLEASIQESGGRPVTRRVQQLAWPAKTLLGVRPLFEDRAETYSKASFEIVMADAKGKKYEAKNLAVRLIRERRDYYYAYGDFGWRSEYTTKTFTVATDKINVPANGTAKVDFPVEWGSYLIEVEDPNTHLVTSSRFWAGYDWMYDESAQDNGSGATRPDQVKLKLDKASYAAGNVARVTVTAPAAGKGYLAIESSDGPLWWKEISVPANGKQFDIPILAEWARHDLYISTQIVRQGDRRTYKTAKRAVGLLHLPLNRQPRKLAVKVSAPEKMRPNQPLTVKVKAQAPKGGKLGANSRVLVSAVDQGILNITRFQTPNPFDTFLTRKRYGVDLLDVWGQVIEAGGNRIAQKLYGGDADLMADGGKRPETSVQIVALQSQVVTLDKNGEATVKLDIPDFNGAVRVMAQVWNDDQFGAGDAPTVIAAPIVAELAAPRFLASGDQTRLALDVTNLTEQTQTVDLRLATEGQIALKGAAARQSLSLEAGKRQTVLIPVEASGAYGKGKVKISISGLKLPGEGKPMPVEREWQLGVRPAFPAEINFIRAELKPGQTWTLPNNALANLDRRGLQLQVSGSLIPPLNLGEHLRNLRAYPYGCLEQTTSGIYPSLYADPVLLKLVGVSAEGDKERIAKINTGIAHIASMQRSEGGFGLWNAESEEETWLTVYATDFLLRARERGFAVPEKMLTQATNRLLQYVRNEQLITPSYTHGIAYTRFSTRAYAAYVLSRSQSAPLGELRSLYEQRKNGGALAQVQLGVALIKMGDPRRGEAVLREGLDFKPVEATSARWYGDYGSTLRDEAQIHAILEEQNLVPDDRLKRLLRLADRLNGRRYLSTQEQVAIFQAARKILTNVADDDWTASINNGNESLQLNAKQPQLIFAGEKLSGKLTLKNNSKAPLFLGVTVNGYPVKSHPKSEKLQITRTYVGLDGNAVDLSKLKSGDLVLAHIEVYASSYDVSDALVVDLLPAGLELENQNLGDAAASLESAAANIDGWKRQMMSNSHTIKHQEFRDDRYVAAVDLRYGKLVHLLYLARAVTPGDYIVPPPTVQSMYRPDWQAVGAVGSNKLKVLPRN